MSLESKGSGSAGPVLNRRLSGAGPGVWFPAVRAGTGVDVFTQRLRDGLNARGIRAEITWLPRRAEFLPWSAPAPKPPPWATIAHVNTWLHRRFIPPQMPVVATMHHSVHDLSLLPYKSLAQKLYHGCWVRPMEAWILRRAESVAAVSRYTALQAQDEFGIALPPVIYNGVPELAGGVSLNRPKHAPFRLLYVGSWSRRKGVDLLGPIMKELGEAFVLRYTSDRGVRPQLPTNCVGLGRPDLLGLKQAYIDSDALLFPTRLEGFGQVALEAMSFGLPVIASNCSAIPEVVEDGRSGLLCGVDDIHGFVKAARRLASDEALWLTMRREAVQRAASRSFGIDSMVDGYLSIYDSIARARNPSLH